MKALNLSLEDESDFSYQVHLSRFLTVFLTLWWQEVQPLTHCIFGHFLLFEHLIMDKGHERNDSIWAALLNTILLIESVEKIVC